MVAQQWKESKLISLHYRSITEPTTSSLKDDTTNLGNVSILYRRGAFNRNKGRGNTKKNI